MKLTAMDFIRKYKEALGRIRGNLAKTNIKGCLNSSIDLTRSSDFVGFHEGVFIGEVLEGIFDNFNDMIRMFDYKEAEIDPIKREVGKLINLLEESIPSNNEKVKTELYDALVSARSCVTHLQIGFVRDKKVKRPLGPDFDMEYE